MKIASPSIMYTATPEGGIEVEGRKTRIGSSSMKIGAYTKDWQINDVRTRNVQPEGMPFPVVEYSYRIKVTTFIPLALFYDIKRYDTVGWWKCSYQEILRHLALADLFVKSDLWPKILGIIDSVASEIYDIILGYYDLILSAGDTSDAQWYYYVDDHSGSACPFEEIKYWGDIIASQRLLDASKQIVMAWEKDFNNYLHSRKDKTLSTKVPHLVKAKYTYPGFRSRPPDYKIIEEDDYSRTLLCSKWRDRKVGGIEGLSQSTWRVYKNKSKVAVEKFLTNSLTKLSGIKVERLADLKLDGYLKLLSNEFPFLYDMKTAEKQTGLALSWTGFACDLSDPRFDPNYAAEMYSGIGPTGPLNEIMQSIILRALHEDLGWDGHKALMFSDNLGVDVKLPKIVNLDESEEFCGLNIKRKVFGPPSLVTDNPKHRIAFNGQWQRQVQSVQYVMRPLLACIMNGIGGLNVTERFLNYVKTKELWVDETDAERKDYLVEDIMKKPEIHSDILKEFDDVKAFVKKFWYVQETDSDFVSNLRVVGATDIKNDNL